MWHQIKSSLSDLNLNCREASRAQSEAMDHPLPPAKAAGLRLHLLICRWCRRYGRQIRFLRDASQRQETPKDSPKLLSQEARERMKKLLQSDK
jgi:hypothetical protein